MQGTFDSNAYWLKRGRGYRGERFPEAYHRVQEQFLLRVLRQGELPTGRILELGCGFGRITKLLAEGFPLSQIAALDLSPDLLAQAQRYCAGLTNVTFHSYDFYAPRALPERQWDIAIAIEVFLHHPESLLLELLPRVTQAAGLIVNIDWSEPWPWARPEHVWIHDYVALYWKAGLQSVAFTVPEKIQGLQHRLFVAGHELPPATIKLADSWAKLCPVEQSTAPAGLPPVAEWFENLAAAVSDIQLNVPKAARLVLVNNDEWGCEDRELPEYNLIPFLEHGGQFWGAPENNAQAIQELERLQSAGAQYLAVAWNAFWWLEHYRDWTRQLFEKHRCILWNERVAIFQL
jgi:SAM-dependent methyltransferase